MIPFSYASQRPIRYLPKLLKKYNERGGFIIEYKRVASCLILSRKSSHYVWVPPNGSRALRSLPDTITTLLFGWWSLYGLFWTIEVLFTNLAGGRDATRELLKATGGGDVALAQSMIDAQISDGRRESVRAILQFAGMITAVVLVFGTLIKVTEWYMNKPGSKYPALPQPVHARPGSNPNASTTPPAKPTRLQAIFYDAKGRSTAIIDRGTVSFGTRVGNYTVVAIEPQTVTLRSVGGEKLVLTLNGAEK